MEDIVESSEEFNKEEEEEYDDEEVYETIEAPKFVDFTLPDRPLPDDRSWFCVRIGCDQNHEDVDPDALHKSFVLRVLAARSPYSRLRKTQTKQATSTSKKCPHSAPAKPSKPRMARMTEIALVSQQRIDAKGKAHPISKMNSTPIRKLKESSIAAKALTTPRHKKVIPNSYPFRSIQNSKAPSAVRKDKVVAKALIFNSPKKAEKKKNLPTPVTDICAGMKKLSINSQRKKPTKNSSESCRGASIKKLVISSQKMRLSKSSSESSRGAASSINKSAAASSSSKPKYYAHKSKSRVKASLDYKGKEAKPVRYVKSRYIKNLPKSLGPQPQNIVDSDSSDMEIEEKSRTGSLAVCSAASSARTNEHNGNEEHQVLAQTNVGDTNVTQQECFPSLGTSSNWESEQTFSTDVYNKQTSNLSNSENCSEEERNVEDNKENEYGRNLEEEKASEEPVMEVQTLNRTGVETDCKDSSDKENVVASDNTRNLNPKNQDNEHQMNLHLTKKQLLSKEEAATVVPAAAGTGFESVPKESDDKENTAVSEVNRDLNRKHYDSQRKTGQHEAQKTHRKLNDGQCNVCVSTAAGKVFQGKHKKTMATKPKPFRLRTDERGVLREANLERVHPHAPKENTTLVPTLGNSKKRLGSEHETMSTHGTMSKTILEPKMVEIRKKKSDIGTGNAGRKFEYLRTTKSQLLRQQLTKPQRVTGTVKKVTSLVSPSGLRVIQESSSIISRPKVATTVTKTNPSAIRSLSRGGRAATVPKEPNTRKIHSPKFSQRH